jgi:NAD-dependent dihydropyrimidine dehydrogenase PreA subunit
MTEAAAMKIEIDVEKCTGCASCHDICPTDPNVFEIRSESGMKKAHVVHAEACLECRACEAQCQETAIKLTE